VQLNGASTLVLSGNNTYSGETTVTAGTLLVTGSIASSAFVPVDSGATLGGTGTVSATLLANGATLAPGLPNALGTLTVNDFLEFCSCVVSPLLGPGIAGLEGTVRVAQQFLQVQLAL
jgi:autotransporter-associated beta strand protein